MIQFRKLGNSFMEHKHVIKKKKCAVIFVCIVFTLFSTISFSQFNSSSLNLYVKYITRSSLNCSNGTELYQLEKWIVITTISKPTEDIKNMAEMKNWKIVIVADQKTPKGWTYKNCIFLSVRKQKMLNYTILQFLPFNSYTRKMIGYLYAVENGAKFIYDTDDDNLPINLGLKLFDYSNCTSGLIRYKSKGNQDRSAEYFNVYSHFGRSDVWPRGYPLEFINGESQTKSKLCSQIKSPIIQQGLVDQDADVDAIYRMIFVKNQKYGLQVIFDPTAPPLVLDENVYCPFNSQNTLFHYEAFWALLLPTTVAFRVTDIWRGYWAQRLLHLTQNYLGFYGPNARQNRNPHSYFKDFLDEYQLYNDTARLVESLQQWQCSTNDFPLCIIELSELMFHKKFWGKGDLLLTKAWIHDLKSVGYSFPKISMKSKVPKVVSCVSTEITSNAKKQSKIESGHLNMLTKLNDLCSSVNSTKFHSDGLISRSFDHTKNVILIIIINNQDFSQIPLLHLLYEPWYANVIYCGSLPANFENEIRKPSMFTNLNFNPEISYVNLTSDEWHLGFFGYVCLTKIISMKIRNIDGYLTIADDMLINFWNPINIDKLSYTPSSCAINDKWAGWKIPYALRAVRDLSIYIKSNSHITLNLENTLNLDNQTTHGVFCTSDIYYVPVRLANQYQFISQLFFDHQVFLEVAMPKIMYSLGWANNLNFNQIMHFDESESILKGKYLWDNDRLDQYKFYNKTDIFLHPLKLSFLKFPDSLKPYCNIYLRSVMNALNGQL